MIHRIPRRMVAALATLTFALSVGEGLLAAICVFGEGEACVEVELGSAATAMDLPTGAGFTVDAPEDARAPGDAACCVPAGSEADPASGDEDPSPCPFNPMGVTGSCQSTAFVSSTHVQLPPAAELLRIFDAPPEGHDLLWVRAPFQPPRA